MQCVKLQRFLLHNLLLLVFVSVNPEDKPQLVMEKVRYSMGDILRGNCTSPPASIPTNMTWLVNGKSVSYVLLILLSRPWVRFLSRGGADFILDE